MRVAFHKTKAKDTPHQQSVAPLRLGVDIVEIARIYAAVERWGERFLARVYTGEELAYCRGRAPQLAGRFAAKEAAMKALGTGRQGVGWKEIEVCKEASGAPALKLHGRAVRRAQALGLRGFAISISHSRDYAVAFVIATSGEAP